MFIKQWWQNLIHPILRLIGFCILFFFLAIFEAIITAATLVLSGLMFAWAIGRCRTPIKH